MRINYITFLCSFCLFISSSYAGVDQEIAASHKCSNLFPYFERKFSIPSNTLHSIALKESGKKHTKHNLVLVWPWAVNVEGKGYYFNTKREAITFVKRQIMQGKEDIDVGCMQISLKHHLEAFDSLGEAFNPATNVEYGAKFLRSKYEKLGSWHKAIAHYHSATDSLGLQYKQAVIRIANNINNYKNSLIKHSSNSDYAAYQVASNYKQEILPPKDYSVMSKRNMRKYKSNIMVMVPNTKLQN